MVQTLILIYGSLSCLEFPTFVTAHFNTIVLTYHGQFQRMSMTPHGCAVSFSHSLATAHITLSSVQCCHCVRLTALKLHGMRPSLHYLMYFIYPKTVCSLSEIDFHDFWGYYIYILGISKATGAKETIYIKSGFQHKDGFVSCNYWWISRLYLSTLMNYWYPKS